ncbi:MAG TPA: integrase core domain-containing protein [bacterium]|nr:integrase core domain-containing protein [bacterium]
MPRRFPRGFGPLGGGYTGRVMIQQSLLPQALRVRMAVLSRPARRRLQWMEFYEAHGHNARLTCRHFCISPATFYRWWRRYNPRRLSSLEDDLRTRRPRRVRQPQTPPALVALIRALREAYPRWGKLKLIHLLAREGWRVSASTVGRTLSRLRALGYLREPVVVQARRERRLRRRRWQRYGQRKPWHYVPRAPGDLVQIDTTPVTVRPGLQRVHFSACDVVSRKGVVAAHAQGTSSAAERVLTEDFPRFGFPVRAIQIDGGSEFQAKFEAACAARGIRLFVLPPRSPKLNGHVERIHRTVQEEFYDLVEVPDALAEHNALLREWEGVYNTERPHQALGYRTPQDYLIHWQTHRQHT